MARLAGNIYRLLLVATLVSLGVAGGAQPVAAGPTTRVSVDSADRQANGPSSIAAMSADGRFVAFESDATNLVTGDTNGFTDIFVRDVVARTTTRVSVDSLGRQANGPSFNPSISSDGRFVAFESNATNLVTGDTNGMSDIFVRDLLTGKTTRVSVDSLGRQANGASFYAAISGPGPVFGPSAAIPLSPPGYFVAFESDATNLVTGDTNGKRDVFVYDMTTRATTRVSVDSLGRQSNGPSYSPAISADGRFVAFESDATNLVAGDTNGMRDVFVHDATTRSTTRVSVDSLGRQANGPSYSAAISADGRSVAFESDGTNLVTGDTNGKRDVFVHDVTTRSTTRVSVDSLGRQSNGSSFNAASSADGRFVAFESDATNLVSGDSNLKRDVFVRDSVMGSTVRASVDSSDRQALGASSGAAISGDGRFVAFESDANNLVLGDTNLKRDVFVHDLR
jgi:Tol biopolymer transport system component